MGKFIRDFIGFRGNSNVNLGLLPECIKNPEGCTGLIRDFVYYTYEDTICIKEYLEIINNPAICIKLLTWMDFLRTANEDYFSELLKVSPEDLKKVPRFGFIGNLGYDLHKDLPDSMNLTQFYGNCNTYVYYFCTDTNILSACPKEDAFDHRIHIVPYKEFIQLIRDHYNIKTPVSEEPANDFEKATDIKVNSTKGIDISIENVFCKIGKKPKINITI